MYEQGVSAALDRVPLGQGVSSGVHESQSRLWENIVARSHRFWEYFYPAAQQSFQDSSAMFLSRRFIAPLTKWRVR